jgi:hypothetical protein
MMARIDSILLVPGKKYVLLTHGRTLAVKRNNQKCIQKIEIANSHANIQAQCIITKEQVGELPKEKVPAGQIVLLKAICRYVYA